MKKVLNYLLVFLPWLLSGLLFRVDNDFYSKLSTPSFALNGKALAVSWLILYILIATSIYIVRNKSDILKNKDYLYVLLTNYLSNQLFLYGFFSLKSPFMGFILTTITFVSTIFLFIETRKVDKRASYFIVPYLLFSVYAFIVALSVYIMNF